MGPLGYSEVHLFLGGQLGSMLFSIRSWVNWVILGFTSWVNWIRVTKFFCARAKSWQVESYLRGPAGLQREAAPEAQRRPAVPALHNRHAAEAVGAAPAWHRLPEKTEARNWGREMRRETECMSSQGLDSRCASLQNRGSWLLE